MAIKVGGTEVISDSRALNNITGADVTGNITVSGTVDGRDIATNIPASLGTAGQVLTVNAGATAGEWADAGGGAWELVADNSFTSVTAYEGSLPTGYNGFKVQMYVSPASYSDVEFSLGPNSGGTGASWVGRMFTANGTTASVYQSQSQTYFIISPTTVVDIQPLGCLLFINSGYDDSSQKTLVTYHSSGRFAGRSGSLMNINSTADTYFRIEAETGANISGTINIYGLLP